MFEEQPTVKWDLPHFAVVRTDRATTKTRVVCDASAKCNGVSLNDMIHTSRAKITERIN